MMHGAPINYIGGTDHRPLPMATHPRVLPAHHRTKPRPNGLDFDALVRRCDICSQRKPGRLTTGACADCAPHIQTPAPAQAAPSTSRGRAKREGGTRKGKPKPPSRATTPNRKVPTTEHAAIARRYLAGETLRQIAPDYGVSQECIGRILRTNNIPLRPRGGNQRNKNKERTTS